MRVVLLSPLRVPLDVHTVFSSVARMPTSVWPFGCVMLAESGGRCSRSNEVRATIASFLHVCLT